MDQSNVTNQQIPTQVNQTNESTQTQDVVPVQQQPVASSEPVSGASKESEPIGTFNKQEIIHPTEQEPVLAPEVKEAGVESIPNQEHLQVKQELKDAGIEPVKTAVSVQSAPTVNIQMPMTEEEAKSAKKTHPAIASVVWLATLIIKQTEKLHQSVKGKIQDGT